MHDVACEFARAAVRSKDAQKQLARTSLNSLTVYQIQTKGKGYHSRQAGFESLILRSEALEPTGS